MRAWMLSIVAVAAVGLQLAGCRGADKVDPRLAKVGTLEGRLVPMPDPPHVGHDSGFAVVLTDGGRPLTGARVVIALFFKTMNQAGPTAPCQEVSPGRYEALELSTGMAGKWEAQLAVSRTAQPDAQLKFTFQVER